MKKYFIALVLSGLVGCKSTSNFTIDEDYHVTKSSAKSRLIAILHDEAKESVIISNEQYVSKGYEENEKEYYRQLGSTPFGGATVEAPRIGMESVVTDDGLLLDLRVHNVKPILYGKGDFLLDPITGDLDPSTAVFIDTVKRIVTRFDRQIKTNGSGYDFTINAVYIGGADKSRLRRPIPFFSEIGSINETVTVNRERSINVNIKNGGYIRNNIELATVRAVAISKAVEHKIAPIKLNKTFNVELSDREGDLYRFVKLRLQIVEAK